MKTLSVVDAAVEMALPPPGVALLDAGMTPREAVAVLLARSAAEALRLLVRLLPRGYVVPWLCQCARAEVLPVDEQGGVTVAEEWLRRRGEDERRAALAFASARRFIGAGALVAAAAAWSEGALLDAEGAEVSPVPAPLMAIVSAAALLTLAAGADDFEMRCRHYVTGALPLLRTEDSP